MFFEPMFQPWYRP